MKQLWFTLGVVARIEQDPQLQEQFQEQVYEKRSGYASMCRSVALELRGIKEKE